MNETQQNSGSTKIQFNDIDLIMKIRDMRRQIYEDPNCIIISYIDEIERSMRRIMLHLYRLHKITEDIEEEEFDDFMVHFLMRIHRRRQLEIGDRAASGGNNENVGEGAASGDNVGNGASGGYTRHFQPQPKTYQQLSTEAIEFIAKDLNYRGTSSANDVIENMIKMIALERNTY